MRSATVIVFFTILLYLNFLIIENTAGQQRVFMFIVLNLILISAFGDWFKQHKSPRTTGITITFLLGIYGIYNSIRIIASENYEPIDGISRGILGHKIINALHEEFVYQGAAFIYFTFGLFSFYLFYLVYGKGND